MFVRTSLSIAPSNFIKFHINKEKYWDYFKDSGEIHKAFNVIDVLNSVEAELSASIISNVL